MNRPARSATRPSVSAGAPSTGWPLGAVFALLLLALLGVYYPSLRGEMLWDDAGHLTSPALQSWNGLWRIWSEPGATQQYYPLLHSAFWLEQRIWGDAMPGYRFINVVWHALAACLFIGLLRRLAVPGALLAGLLFAFHPVCVESVAWISEQKNTLSAVFYLAAALAWLRFEEARRPARYLVATLWFVAALLTKTVTATLPAALLVIAWWRRGRVSWRSDVLPLLPWFGAGAGMGLFTAWFERTGIGAQGGEFELGLVERGLLAGRVICFYLGKLAWPADLAFFYPRWRVDAAEAAQYLFPLGVLLALGALVAWTRRGRGRGPLAAALLFGGTLFPVLGFLNVYPFVFSYVADHFQYLASLSVFALVAAGFDRARRGSWLAWPAPAARAAAIAAVAALALLSRGQSGRYSDPIALYRATLARNPESWVAHHNLALELSARGAPAEALPHARRALELRPDYPEALNNVADNLIRTGQPAAALPLVERALQLQPRYAQAENTWGAALLSLGKVEDGIRHFQRAIALQPDLAEAHFNLGLAHAERGDFNAAIAHFAETVRLRPRDVAAELKWGVALAAAQRLPEARPHFDRAIELAPDSAALRQAYGRVLLNAADWSGALVHLRAAWELDPALPGLNRELAIVLQQLGRTEEARAHALAAGAGR